MKIKNIIIVSLILFSVSMDAQIKFNRNISNEANQKITQLLSKGINNFSFSPNGGWVLITKNNGYFARNIPSECFEKIRSLKSKGHKIQQVSFPPKGGSNSWIIITDKSTFARNIPKECFDKVEEYKKKGKKIKSVSFPYKNIFNSSNNSWVVITTDGNFYARNIPDECYQIMRNLRESDMPNKTPSRKISQVSFTPSGGWVILADEYFFARNIPKEAFSQLKSFQNKKYKSNIISFTPNGKGWSLIANEKYNGVPKDLIRKFENNVDGKSVWQVMRENNVPGISVAVVINGKVAWKTAYGHLKKGEKRYAVHPESMFQAASISKVIAAIGAHKMVDQSKVSLTENLLTSGKLKTKIPLHKCLKKDDFKNFKNVTIENILQHRSGIEGRGAQIKMTNNSCNFDEDGNVIYKDKSAGGGYGGYDAKNNKIPNSTKLMESVNITYNPSTRPNGKSRWYSGKAFTTLQKLTEDINKRSYSSWMKSNILDPLKMDKSRFTVKPRDYYKADNLARGHNGNGKLIDLIVYPQYAAAGLYTNAPELANMIIMINNKGVLKNNKILSTTAIKNLVDKDMGVNVTKSSNKVIYYSHGGTNTGFKADFRGYPNINKNGVRSAGIVVLTNGDKDIRMLVRKAIIKAYGW
jgi:CubicO group peptidase (beta-lactamase class C family)